MKIHTGCLKFLLCSLLPLFVVLAVSVTVHAQTNYNVGPGQTYVNLESLRNTVATWGNGDTITLHGDDDSLTDAFDFDDNNNITFRGYGKITPNTSSPIQLIFQRNSRTITVLPDHGKTLTFEGFHVIGLVGGGVIDGGDSTVILGAIGSNGKTNFVNNQAIRGGAIISDDAVNILGGTNTFINNRATNTGPFGGGGAIHGRYVTISGGTNTFLDNTAETLGGAIFAYRDVTLIADGGNITFQGNKHGTSPVPNAIYVDNDGGGNTLALAAVSGRSILFYDPIESNSAEPDLTIAINNSPNYTGTILFDGSQTGGAQSNVYGNTTVYNGTMQLTNRAIYSNTSALGNWGTFTLDNNATLLSDVHFNEIIADNITLDPGSILAFDMAGAQINGTTKNLTLTGAAFTGQAGANNIELRNFRGLAIGEYQLAETNVANTTADTGQLLSGVSKMNLESRVSNQELWLNVMDVYGFSDTPNLRPNSLNIAEMLDANPTHTLYTQLNWLTESEATDLLNQLPGDVYANAQLAVTDLRKGFNGLLPTGKNVFGEYVAPFSDSYRGQNPESVVQRNFRAANNIWATPTGRYATRNSHGGYYGYDLGNVGIVLGKSWQLGHCRHIGLAVGYDYANLDMRGINQNDEIQALNFAVYGGYNTQDTFFDYQIGFGKNWHGTSRNFGTAHYDDNVLSASAMLGRNCGVFLPSLGVEVIQVRTSAFEESGGIFALRTAKSDYMSIELPIGSRLTKTYRGVLTPELRAFWVPQLGDQSSSVTTSFASGSPNFLVDSGDFGWQHLRLGTGLTAKFNHCWSGSLNYDAALYEGTTRQVLSASLIARF